jgi:hypothetical protein
MVLIQISTPSICSGDYWNGVFQNAIGCGIGSFIAVLASIYIYRRQTRENNKSMLAAIELKERNQLKAFSIMLKNAIDPVTKQSQNFEALITEAMKFPTVFPLLKLHTWGNLKRIIDTITVEHTGLAYMKHIKSDNSAEEFTSILNTVDYLYFQMSGLPSFLERSSLNHSERQIEYRDVFDSVDTLIRNYVSTARAEDKIAIRITKIKGDYLLNRVDETDLLYTYSKYVIPVIEFMKELVYSNAINKFVEELTFLASKAEAFYKSIEVGYEKFADEVKVMKRDIDKNLSRLENDSKALLQSEFSK